MSKPSKKESKPFRLGLITACWSYGAPERSRAEQLVLRYTAELEVPGVELVRVASWSREDPLHHDLIHIPGWHFVQVPNFPISDKWIAASRALKTLDVDAMMIFGSDDFLNATFITAAVNKIKAGAKYVMPKACYFYEANLKEAIYCRLIGRLGGGRTLCREILDATRFEPWERGVNRSIDGGMDRKLVQILGSDAPDALLEDIASFGGLLLGIKTGDGLNMQPYDRMKRALNGEIVDAKALFREHIPQYAGEILAW